jgi:hypothetical protein
LVDDECRRRLVKEPLAHGGLVPENEGSGQPLDTVRDVSIETTSCNEFAYQSSAGAERHVST